MLVIMSCQDLDILLSQSKYGINKSRIQNINSNII